MIKVNPIEGKNGSLKPEYIPEKYFGQHFDGVNFYFFESDEEHKEYLDSLPEQEQAEKEEPKIDLIPILKNMTDEEKQLLKQILMG